MGFKEVYRVDILEMLRRWQAGASLRTIARSTGLSRETVRKYVLAAEQSGLSRDGPLPTEEQVTRLSSLNVAGPRQVKSSTERLLSTWAERIRQWIKEDHLQLTRVHELMVREGCMVSYSSLRRFVVRTGLSPRKSTTVRMVDTKPGEVAEMDFGRLGLVRDPESGRRRTAWALVVVLPYSRHSFVWPMFRQQLSDVIEGLDACWAFFEGMPRYLVLDNFPAAVAGPDSLNPRLTRGFLEYTQHRGFIADPARVRHPQDKPRVESAIRYVRERFFKGDEFQDLADLRGKARRWCREIAGQRVHGTTRRLPLVVFESEEQAALLPWDGEPYDVPCWRDVMVHPDHHIAHACSLYSVPYHSCPPGTKLEVRGNNKLVHIYKQGMVVKVHPRMARGGRSTDPEDYPPELTSYTTRCPHRLCRKSAELGEHVGAFAEKLLAGPLPWAKIRQAQKLLRLGERYTPARLDAACQKALEVDLIDVRRLERILVQALEHTPPGDQAQQRPRTPLPSRFARHGSTFAYRQTTLERKMP